MTFEVRQPSKHTMTVDEFNVWRETKVLPERMTEAPLKTAADLLAEQTGRKPKAESGKPAKRGRFDPVPASDEVRTGLITILGKPLGKPRMTQRDKWKQRACVVRYRQWADAARLLAGRLPPPESIERLDWTAYFAPPRSWSKAKRAAAMGELHRTKPDRDNVDKAVLDALFDADAAIAQGTIVKRWGEPPRLEIFIELTEAASCA